MIPLLALLVFGADAQSTSTPGLASQSPPLIGSVPRDLLVRQSESLTLKCPLTSPVDEHVQYQWFRDGQPVSGHNTNSPDLTINSAAASDLSGIYRCSARTSIGGSVSETTNVSVAAFGPFANAGAEYFRRTVSKNGWVVLTPPSLLTLSPSSIDAVHWQWSFFDQAVYSNLTHYVTTKGELVILNLQTSNQGQYSVEAHHTLLNQRLRSPSYELDVQDSNIAVSAGAPEIVLRPHDTTLFKIASSLENSPRRENDVILECVATASDLVNVQIVWTYNNTILTSDGVKYAIEEFNRRLIVRNPQPFQDSGLYTCEVRAGSFSANKADATVSIYGPPRITTTLPAVAQAQLGRAVEITCTAVGAPSPSVRWFYNGEQCCRGGNISTAFAQGLPSGSLVISAMGKEHVGIYQCEATNEAGSVMASTWLRANTQEPTIVEKPTNISAVSGQSITLPCTTSGSPPPTVHWQLNGTDLELSGNTNMRLNDDGTLVINNVGTEHGGWYTCIASNSIGKTEARVFVFVAGKTQITSGPEDQSVIIGSNVVFPCAVSIEAGDGGFVRNWYFKNQLLTQGALRNIELRSDGSLLIRQVGPMNIGPYSCTVTGPSGTQRQTGNLKIVEKPGMPLYVKAELINDTLPAKVSISWVDGFDGNSVIIKYLIESRYLGAQALWSNWESVLENVRHDQKTVLIDNLKPSTIYEFRVIAINRFGAGMPSLPSNNVTLPQQPPAAAPQNADGSARSASSIMFQWQPPPKDQWNGDILGYILRYRLANYPDIPWISKNITDPRARNVLIDDLITWREYEIQVAAYNERGMGVFSKSRYITTLEGPPTDSPYNVAVNVLNSTAVHISLSPPQQQMVPGVNQGYKVEAWKGTVGHGSAARTLKILPYSLTKIDAIMNGLEKYVRYNITTLCFTAPGDGPRSHPIEIRTKQDVPDIVSNFRVEEVLFSSVKILWDRPIHPNGILTNYTLSYWVSNQTETAKKTIVLTPNITSYKVEGLTPSTRYSFDLYASTEIGRGPSQTANIESGVPPELPGPPTALAVSNIQARSAALQFTPGFDGKTTISKWIVEALVGASTSWAPIFNVSAPDARAFTVTTLRPYMSYKLRLVAENVVGRSPPSEQSALFETLQAPPEYPPPEADAQPVSATTIKITWTPLQLQAWNGIAKGYIIIWQKAVNESDLSDGFTSDHMIKPTQVTIEDPGASEYRLENLEPFTHYDVVISAYNNVGQSNTTSILKARTYEAAPTSPPGNLSAIAVSATEIRVSWLPLPRRESKGKILGYKVSYRATDKNLHQKDGLETVVGEEQRSLVLRGLAPFAQYLISASAFTIVGTGPFAQVVTVTTKEDIPSVPSEIVFSSVSLTEARISWKPPYRPNGLITHYSVAFWPQKTNTTSLWVTGAPVEDHQGRDGVTKTSLSPDLTTFLATGLTPKMFYTFAVAAENSVGWGHEAQVLLYTSNTQVPPPSPGRPAQSVTHTQGSRQITIVWDIVPSATEPVRLFDVSYQRVNDDQWVSWVERIPGSMKTATITGLLPNKAYRFRVRAVNDFGDSRFSPESDWIKTLEADPTLPPVDVQAVPFEADGVKISWQAPPFDGWNSDFVGYRILYKPYESNETVRFQELPMSGGDRKQWTYELKGLPRFNHYLVQMQTFNQEGSSPSSAPVFAYVGFSVPKTSVNRLRAETLSSTQVRVSWDTWPQQDDPVSGFKVNYLIIGRPKTEVQQDIAKPDENSFVIRDLPKFTNFTIEVVPFNKAGDGPSSSVSVQTLPDRPGAVGQLVFSDILIDSVNVSWQAPTEPNGVIIGYLVTYKTYKLEDEYIKQIQEKVSRNYLVVSNLEENVTSTFSVLAETAVGYGPPVTGKVTVGPQPGSPDPPGRPRFQPKENSVTLEWDNGASGRGPITAYLVQTSLVDEESDLGMDGNGNPVRRRPVREVLISPNAVSSLRWDTLALVENPQPIYTVPYNQLQPGGYYRFRVIARNSFGVSYPSAPTDPPLKIPEDGKNKPFYLEWWFLVILALVSLVIIVVIVAVLYITGRDQKYKYARRNSDQSLHLADGGIVTYELRASKRPQNVHHHHRDTNGHHGKHSASASSTLTKPASNPYGRHPASSRPDPLKTLIFNPTGAMDTLGPEEEDGNGGSGRGSPAVSRKQHPVGSFGKLPNLYHSLGSGVNGGAGSSGPVNKQARSMDAVHAMEESRITEKTDLDATSSGDEFNGFDDEEEHNQDRDISSIVQHYETSDGIYRETWRRAKSTAHRPVSTSSQQSDAVTASVVNPSSRLGTSPPPPPPYARSGMPNFSSFV